MVVVVGEGAVVGADDEMVTGEAVVALVGPVFVFASTTEFWTRPAITVPSEPQDTDTVIDDDVDDDDGTKVQLDAVPRFWKSPAEIPETGSENVSVYVMVRLDDGDAGGVHVAVGAVPSAVELLVRGRPVNDDASLPARS